MTTLPPNDSSQPATSRSSDAPVVARRGGLLGLGVVVFLVLLVLIALGAWPKWRAKSALAIETEVLATPSVIVVSPIRATNDVAWTLPGELRPYLEASIYSRVSGYVKRWTADIGSQVAAGEVLAELDTPELDQELAKARAALTESESRLAFAKTSAARWLELSKNASVSKQETEEKVNDVSNRIASLEAAKAEVHRLEDLQRYQKLVAPFEGKITRRSTDVGELITAGSGKELFHLVQSHQLRVFVRVPQTASRQITLGQVATVTLAEFPGRTFQGTVVRTAGALDPNSRTLLTELSVQNPDGELLPGAFAQVRFKGEGSHPALTLPSNTLLFRSEGPQVGVVKAEGIVELRDVKLGRDFGTALEILVGVSETDSVILNPSDSLSTGAKVQVLSGKRP